MFIVYKNTDEVIVTTPSQEKKTIKLYFTEGGRDFEDFDRKEVNEPGVSVSSKVCLD